MRYRFPCSAYGMTVSVDPRGRIEVDGSDRILNRMAAGLKARFGPQRVIDRRCIDVNPGLAGIRPALFGENLADVFWSSPGTRRPLNAHRSKRKFLYGLFLRSLPPLLHNLNHSHNMPVEVVQVRDRHHVRCFPSSVYALHPIP